MQACIFGTFSSLGELGIQTIPIKLMLAIFRYKLGLACTSLNKLSYSLEVV
jgi:hypothetical protein